MQICRYTEGCSFVLLSCEGSIHPRSEWVIHHRAGLGTRTLQLSCSSPAPPAVNTSSDPPLLIPMLRLFARAANNDEKVRVGAFSVIEKLLWSFVSSSLFAARRPTAYFDKPKGPPCEVLKTKTWDDWTEDTDTSLCSHRRYPHPVTPAHHPNQILYPVYLLLSSIWSTTNPPYAA